MATAATTAHRHRTARFAVAALHLLLLAALLHEHVVPPIGVPVAGPERIEIRWLPARARAAGPERNDATSALPPPHPLAAPPRNLPRIAPGVAASPEPRPQIDWAREAERVARHTPLAKSAPRTDCEDTDRPGAMTPRCAPRRPEFHWGHDPRAVEFSGGLPYVHLGKRCIVGLGFFGCAVGTLPEPNGHLFDDRGDPDRPRSSVPDAPDPQH